MIFRIPKNETNPMVIPTIIAALNAIMNQHLNSEIV